MLFGILLGVHCSALDRSRDALDVDPQPGGLGMREDEEEVPPVSLLEMGPGAPMPTSFLHVDSNLDPKNASWVPKGSFLETGPGAPVPLNFFLVNSSLDPNSTSSGDREKEAEDSTSATNSTLAGKQPASPERPVDVSTPDAVHPEDIPRPIQRQMEHVTQTLAIARASVSMPTSHEIFLTVLGIGSVVFTVILIAIMRCVYDAMYSAYEGAVERSRPPSLLSSLRPGPMEKGLETLLRIPETARQDTVAKKEAALAETGSTCSEGTLAKLPAVREIEEET